MYENVLAQVPLFSDLSASELQALAAAAREREFAPGDTLLTEGEAGAGLFVLLSGSVRVSHRAADGSEQPLATMERGAVIGEMSLLDDLPRSATVRATEPTRTIVIPVWGFRSALHESPDMALKLLAVLTKRLRAAEGHGA